MTDTHLPTSTFRYLRTATGTRLQYAWSYSERDQWIDVPIVEECSLADLINSLEMAPKPIQATTPDAALIPGLEHARGIANHWWQRFSMLNGTLEARGAGQVLDEIDAELRRLRGEMEK